MVSPTKELGTIGVAVFGGYIEDGERNDLLGDGKRFETAADILRNISVIGASVRYFLNLLANPAWHVNPANDSPEAKRLAEFVESIMQETASSWTRIVRRSGFYRYHGLP